jgi:hypothetical protein
MDTKRKLGLIFVCMTAPALALAQDHGSGESGGGCGDVLGDLVHILRHATTGQPILQKRWVELPENAGFGWAYCPIPVDQDGAEIGFLPDSCDVANPEAVVEVDYFGRLSGGRTKERNSRMHFDEVISSIKDPAVGWVGREETGRLQLGYDCATDGLGAFSCTEYRVIDSPMENMAIYTRLMKYGHFQTDPKEEDTWSHGDPAAGVQYHPALTAADYQKFSEDMRHLLPGGEDAASPELNCFTPDFVVDCASGQELSREDLAGAAKFLSGAASKTGRMTVDLVQYMNRILKVTIDTPMSTATVKTLPAQIRDCGGGDGGEYLPVEECTIGDATDGLPFPASERFVDFGGVKYNRGSFHNRKLEVLQDEGSGTWTEVGNLQLMTWLEFVDQVRGKKVEGLEGFVLAAHDGLRAIEFVHNYAIPDDLWTLYATQEP